jgi:transcriptional regulator with XRE-family HTH domain
MEITSLIATNLRKERVRQKLTREALGEMAKVTAKTVYDIENEIRKPSITVLESLARSLDLSVTDLLSGEARREKVLPLSGYLKKLSFIPDEVFEKMQGIPKEDPCWEAIKYALNEARERIEKLDNKEESS